MTTAVWSIAGARAWPGKLFLPGLASFWVALYLALGWLVVVALKPMIDGLAWYALLLLVAGGVLYSTGVIFYVNKRLKFPAPSGTAMWSPPRPTHWVAVLRRRGAGQPELVRAAP